MLSCSHSTSDESSHDHDEKAAEKAEHSDDEIIIHEHDAEKLGIVAKVIAPETFHNVMRVSGEVLPATGHQGVVSSPASGIIRLNKSVTPGVKVNVGTVIGHVSSKNISGGDTNEAARVAVEAAKRELDRATPLHQDGIITTKEYNALKYNYEAALSAYSAPAASGNAVSPVAGTLTKLLVQNGEFVNTGQPIAEISNSSRLTLRADVPPRMAHRLSSVQSANLRQSNGAPVIVLAEHGGRLDSSPAPMATSQAYIPVYFSFENNGQVVSGSFAEVYLIGSDRVECLVVPRNALVEQFGELFVFVKTGKDVYEKRKVTVGDDDGMNVEILEGIKAGDEVVVEGAMSVRLKEMSGAVPEGHSHTH